MAEKLHVIAVERNNIENIDTQNVFSCVYKDGVLYLYGTEEENDLISDYFSNMDMLDYFVDSGKYEWTNFYIEKGQKVSRNRFDEILVDGEQIDAYMIMNPEKSISSVSAKIFYEFLKVPHKKDENAMNFLRNEVNLESLKSEIQRIVNESEDYDLSDLDREMIAKANIRGHTYIIDMVKQSLQEMPDNYSKVYYLFSRLFKLETNGYIKLE